MGYTFHLISKERDFTEQDFKTAMGNLSPFNQSGLAGDIEFNHKYIRISGSYGISGKYCEGFVLNLLMCLLDLGYRPKVINKEWDYGTEEDFKWLEDSHKLERAYKSNSV